MAAAAIPLAISGISALSGWLSNRKKQQQQQQTQTQNINELQAPEYDPKTSVMKDTLMNYYLDRAGSNDDFFGGYQQQGLKNINQSFNTSNEAIQNMLASRGLGGTTAGASALVGNRLNQGNQQAALMNSIPMLRDQRMQSNLTDASAFFRGLPVASRRTGTNVSNTTGTVTDPGNPLGGAFGGLANSLFGLYGAGAFDKGFGKFNSGPSTSGYNPGGAYNPNLNPAPIDFNIGSAPGVQMPGVNYGPKPL